LGGKFLHNSGASRREAVEVRLAVFSGTGPILASALDVRRGFAILALTAMECRMFARRTISISDPASA
jgi:hypothetical protein